MSEETALEEGEPAPDNEAAEVAEDGAVTEPMLDSLAFGLPNPTVVACGGEGERPCGITTSFFWENGGLFADRGLKATGFNVLPDVSFNANDWIDLTQLDATQYRPYQAAFETFIGDLEAAALELERLVTVEWEDLEARITALSATDFVTPQCFGIADGDDCWVTPPFSLDGYREPLGDLCIPLDELDFADLIDSNCTVTVPGVPSAKIPFPTFSESGWQVPTDVGQFFIDVTGAVNDLLSVRLRLPNGEIVIPDFIKGIPAPGPLPVTALGDFADVEPIEALGLIATALTDFKTMFSEDNVFIRPFIDLYHDLVNPPGTVVNDTRRQPVATAFQDSWELWALLNQRELGRFEPLNWTQFITTHNAFNNVADGYLLPNQGLSVTDQLRTGARGIALDIHWYNDNLRLCHGQASHAGCSGVDRYYDSVIKEIANWLRANPGEVIVIGFEDRSDGHDAYVNDPLAAHLADLVYTPALGRQIGYADEEGERYWPSLDMIRAAGKQVLLFSDDQHGGAWIWPRETNPFQSARAKHFFFTAADYDGSGGQPQPYAGGDYSCWSYWGGGEDVFAFDRNGEDNTRAMFSSVYEARSLLDPFDESGLLGPDDVAQLALCPVTEITLDFFNATELTNPGVCDGDLACQRPDERAAAAVWSWREGDRGDHGDAALLDGASGRWRSVDPNEENHFACALARDGSPENWLDQAGGQWKITAASGPWRQGGALCHAEFGDEGYAFAAPAIGWQNARLVQANLGDRDVWVNFNDIAAEGEWRVNRRPIADAGDDLSAFEGDWVQFDASATEDPDNDPIGYHWDFGDGASASGPTPRHVYADDGEYTVALTVEDPYAGYHQTTITVSVANVAPTILPIAGQSVVEGALVSLPPVSFTDPGFDCPGCTPTSAETFTATIDWGEGSVEAGVVEHVAGGTDVLSRGTVGGSHLYGDDGNYLVSVCVSDDDAGLGCGSFTVVVANLAPSVAIAKGTAIGFPSGAAAFLARRDEPQRFDALASDPGSDDITASWRFPPASGRGPGDGVGAGAGPELGETITYFNDGRTNDPYPSPHGTFPFEVATPNVTTFTVAGVYRVELGVEDDDGGTAADDYDLLVSDDRACTMVTAQWRQQFGPQGRQHIDEPRLAAYLDLVRFGSSTFDHANLGGAAAAAAILTPGGGDGRAALERETLAAWLNFASGGVAWDEPLPRADGLSFGELVASVEGVLLDPGASRGEIKAAEQLARRVQNSRPGNPSCDG